MSINPVITSLASPDRLEALYHEDQQRFAAQLQDALAVHPQAQILKFWQARLAYQQRSESATKPDWRLLASQVFLLASVAFLAARLPLQLGLADEWYLPRFLPWIVLTGLTAQAAWSRHIKGSLLLVIGALSLASLLLLSLLPDHEGSDSVTMALLHTPVLLIWVLGLTVTAGQWRSSAAVIDCLHYYGELFILTVLIALGGFVTAAITMALFSLINLDVSQFYAGNMALAGVVTAPLIATLVYEVVLQRRSRFASLIANIFAPLFLLTVVVFLATLAATQRSPYTDRDFLITFNALLLLVLGITIYSISGRDRRDRSRLADCINTGLVTVTLAVNLVALSAIMWRLSTWGLTPNRVAVIGANLLIFCHLLIILAAYLQHWRGTANGEELRNAVTRFLPVYGGWAALVILLLPVLFGFR